MSFAKKHNKGGVLFDINIEDFKFTTLKDLYENDAKAVYGVDGIFINNKSKYGSHPVIINTALDMLVDLPKHMLDDVKKILEDPEDVELIKSGKVGFSIEEYKDKNYGKTCYGVKWEDI